MGKIVWIVVTLSLTLSAGVMETLKNEHKIRIGIKYDTKPFGFKEGKKIKGFDLDFSKLIVAEIQKHEKLPKLKVFYKKVIPANRETMLASGRVDMVIATYSITEARKKSVMFSVPYFTDDISIVHRNGKIDTPVGVLQSATAKAAVEKMGYQTQIFSNYDDLFRAFKEGKVDAIASNTSILNSFIQSHQYSVTKTPEVDQYAVGLPKDDEAFKKMIDEIIGKLKKSGAYEKLYDKWFGSDV
jgi:putative glutamine transport system substrate-binding protein